MRLDLPSWLSLDELESLSRAGRFATNTKNMSTVFDVSISTYSVCLSHASVCCELQYVGLGELGVILLSASNGGLGLVCDQVVRL